MNFAKSHTTIKILLCGAFLLVELLSKSSIGLAQGPFTEKAPMPTARSALCTAVLDGKIYAIGGLRNEEAALSVVEVYDPATDTWTTKTPMPTARCVMDCAIVDRKIYVIGGSSTAGSSILSTVEVYDPTTDTWATKTPLPAPRSDVAVEAVNGKIYVIGGSKRTGSLWTGLSTVEEYDPVTDTWTTKSNMPTRRWSLGTCVRGAGIYAIGGNVEYPTIARAVEVYYPATDTWSEKAPMPTSRYSLSTCFVNGKIFAFGGWRASGRDAGDPIFNIVEEYDVNTNTWIRKTDMPLTIALLSTETLNGKIYLIGGTSKQHTFNSLNTTYEYDPALDLPSGENIFARQPSQSSLYQNYPNPFNFETQISYEVDKYIFVILKIINMQGQEIRTLVNEEKPVGVYEVTWDGKDDHGHRAASGVYFYQLESKDCIRIRRMVLLQ